MKKRILSMLLVIAMVLCMVPTAFAANSGTCGENLTWTLDSEGTMTISGKGAMTNYNSGSAPWYSNWAQIKKVVIESGVTTIGKYAFYRCESLANVTIPDSVTTIADYAFNGCTKLTNVTIPNSVKSIGKHAFRNCDSLTSVTIPDGMTTIGYYTFSYCDKLTSVTIPDSVTSIDSYAFANCTNLTSVTIPDSVTSIGDFALSGCDKLTSIIFTGDPPTIGYNCFSNVTATAYYPEGNATWTSDVMQNYGEKLTWVAGCPHISTNMIDVKAATCTATGYTGDKACAACGKTVEKGTKIAMIAHSQTTVKGNAATCTKTGLTDGVKCSVCGSVITAQKTIPVKGHSYGAWVQVTAPTIQTKGSKQRTCSSCGAKETQDIAKLVNPFTDVPNSAYYANAVAWAASNNITTGTTKTTFSPNDDCTRAQIVTFLWRSMGSPEPSSTKNPFTDVKATSYYYKAVLWAVEKGITNGTSATTFSPDDNCTRAQAVTFLWRTAGKPASSSKANKFTDLKSGAYYIDAVAWAVKNEITNGTGGTFFSPDVTCTRGQIVTFLWRYKN